MIKFCSYKKRGTNITRYIKIYLHTNSFTACYYNGKDYKFNTYATNTLRLIALFEYTLDDLTMIEVKIFKTQIEHLNQSIKEIDTLLC